MKSNVNIIIDDNNDEIIHSTVRPTEMSHL